MTGADGGGALGRFAGLAVVVVSYGSADLLAANLAPLTRALPGGFAVVVDNRTTDDERRRLRELAAVEGWLLVEPDTNLGFGPGMNAGVSAALDAGAGELLLLNPDASIAPDDVAALLAVVRDGGHEEPGALVAPRILRPDGSVWFDGSDLHLGDGRISATRKRAELGLRDAELWLSGACLLLPARLWRTIGGFGDGYFLYWEDVELSYRARRAGARVLVVQEATAVHAEGGTQGAGLEHSGQAKSETYYYFNIRNRLVFAARNLDVESVARWRRASLPIAYEVLLQGGRRQFLRPIVPLRAAFRGVRDGLRASRAAGSSG
ncbi:glycosyltransferase family 2 protein [Leifsonia sp. NPDC056665]|uniref:glycosyltransferase family 2 protein n=1 Tax=Leifsonia sp. NPDC056665 TaxID=3345901 RepID=UPI0036BFF4B8